MSNRPYIYEPSGIRMEGESSFIASGYQETAADSHDNVNQGTTGSSRPPSSWHQHPNQFASSSLGGDEAELQSRGPVRSRDPPSSTTHGRRRTASGHHGMKSSSRFPAKEEPKDSAKSPPPVSPLAKSGPSMPYVNNAANGTAIVQPNREPATACGRTPSDPYLPRFKSQSDEEGGSSGSHPSPRHSNSASNEPIIVHASPVPQNQIQTEADMERQRHSNELKDRSSNLEKMARQSLSQQQEQQDREAKLVSRKIWCCVAFAILLVAAIAAAVGGVCGVGYCSPSSPLATTRSDVADSPSQPTALAPSMAPVEQTRAVMITSLINDRTLTGSKIRYPALDPTPEEEALSWLIEDDPAPLPATHTDRLIVRYVLLVMWYSMVIPRTDAFTNSWLIDDDECNWKGILSCPSGVVDSIEVRADNTDADGGKLPQDIGLLTALTSLVLITNSSVTGTIPTTLGRLTDLHNLRLEQNQLSGTIPPEVSALTKLTRLSLFGNKLLIGPVPNIAQLTLLQALELYDNGLTGPIPSAIGGLTSLTYLGLHNNVFVGTIPNLSSLLFLQSLVLYGNKLTGSIPSSIGLLTSLRTLYLGTLSLSGTIPSELTNLSLLETLSLYESQLTGTIPDLSALTNLEALFLHKNPITGSIPSSIGSLTSLTTLILSDLNVTGTIPSDLSNLSGLVDLFLHRSQLVGTLPNLSALSNIEILTLNENALTGPIPSSFNSLTKLINFEVYTNELNGTIPDLSALTNLETLLLFENALSGPIPSGFEFLTSLIKLESELNQLTGQLPNLGALTLLETLWLNQNRLVGPLPTTLGSLTSLTELSLFGNALSGTVPTELRALTALQSVFLFNTDLNGTFPFCLVPGISPIENLIVDCDELNCPCCTLCCPEGGWNDIPGWISSIPGQACEA